MDFYVERKFEKVLIENGWEPAPTRECPSCAFGSLVYFCPCTGVTGRKQNVESSWKRLVKRIDPVDAVSWIFPARTPSNRKFVADAAGAYVVTGTRFYSGGPIVARGVGANLPENTPFLTNSRGIAAEFGRTGQGGHLRQLLPRWEGQVARG